jgi:hypothetical protein
MKDVKPAIGPILDPHLHLGLVRKEARYATVLGLRCPEGDSFAVLGLRPSSLYNQERLLRMY